MIELLTVNLEKADDLHLVGGKACALGRLLRAGFNVPAGFVVTNNVIVSHEKALQNDIINHFNKLGAQFMAVRSSAVHEDSINASWAGQLDTYLNTDINNLLDNIEKCQNSNNSAHALAYSNQKSISANPVAVIVQKMIQGDVSGVAFSVHPVTKNEDNIVVEAGFGLGEAVVSGQITPDTYIINKTSNEILNKHISHQTKKLSQNISGENSWQDLGENGKTQKLTDKQIRELSEIIKKLEDYFGHPVDVEWALCDDIFYILQSRPITTL